MVAGDLTAAEACFEEALTLCREAADGPAEAQALHDLAQVAGLRQELGEARSLFKHSLDIRTRLGIREEGHVTMAFVALLALLAGDSAEARSVLREALESARRLEDRQAVWAVDVQACLAGIEGRCRTAVVLAGAAAGMHAASGTAPPETWRQLIGLWLDPARAALSPADGQAAWDEGYALTFDAALEHALAPAG